MFVCFHKNVSFAILKSRPGAGGYPEGTQREVSPWPAPRDFLKNRRFLENAKIERLLASGPGGIDRTRREELIAPNESSVGALGASLVTKKAGRVSQHD